MTSVRHKVSFGRARRGGPRRAAAPASRVARQLALAHYVEQLVSEGQLKDYARAAEILGVTRARVTQVMTLLNLSPDIQERILVGDLRVSERRLRPVVGEASWEGQAQAVDEYLRERNARSHSLVKGGRPTDDFQRTGAGVGGAVPEGAGQDPGTALERVEFDAAEGEVAITFRPGGPKAARSGAGASPR